MQHRTKVLLGIGFLSLALCGGAGWAAIHYVYDFPIESGKLEARLKEAKEVGVPLTFEDLNYQTEVADSDNAAALLAAAVDRLSQMEDYKRVSESVRQAFESGDLAGVEAQLRPFNAVIDDAAAASMKPLLRTPNPQWGYPLLWEFPEYHSYLQFVQLMAVRARLRASQGDLGQAEKDIRAIRRLAGLMDQQPFLIGVLVSLKFNRTADVATVAIVSDQFKGKEGRRLSADSLLKGRTDPDWNWALRSEAFQMIQTSRNLDRVGGHLRALSSPIAGEERAPAPPTLPARTTELPEGMAIRGSFSRSLEPWIAFYRAFPDPSKDILGSGKALTKLAEIPENSLQLSRVSSAMLMPIFDSAAAAIVEHQLRDSMLRIYEKILAHRKRTGSWPTSLQVIDVITVDPFNNAPLHYRKEEGGFRLWSVGPNRIDENGLDRREKPQQKGFDIVLRYPPNLRLP